MTETITVRGFLGGDVRLVTTDRGLPIATFRLASTPRRFDRERQTWVDGETNWYSVACFRSLAQNVRATLGKGDPVVVTGRLKIRRWENEHGQRGTAVDIDADGVGYDLTFGTGSFVRLGTGPGEGARGGADRGPGDGPGDGSGEGPDEEPGGSAAGDVAEPGVEGASGDSAAAAAWGGAPAGEREPAPF